MKKKFILLLYIISIYACAKGWAEEDKKRFLSDLKHYSNEDMGLCLLECLEQEYINYDSAQFAWNDTIDPPSNQLVKCIAACRQAY